MANENTANTSPISMQEKQTLAAQNEARKQAVQQKLTEIKNILNGLNNIFSPTSLSPSNNTSEKTQTTVENDNKNLSFTPKKT